MSKDFKSKYTIESEKDNKDKDGKPINANKKVLSDDAYAICQLLENIANEVRR